ncbi:MULTISPECIES: Cys-tRNA(Pro) deacylase [unclassified Staphylococcus]|uniref:Cys-tRNA(Pro) deacylase n=1 Tax=unclassified Staphylococcus TaxID=91994 RepID=UPI0021CF83BB|nr:MULTISPECIES: Cys-tRNA(Pro) deacylase [unclassified Staphylococcus]UXR69944.1 Cys-tRNA(Pro) deacylase [Staphylococcus sp. IVB6246]UXR71984.1 Cys-tRNA(Pro) deacylase [Staphylococcus sp. IVB6240]UXR74291.1 Cys-tRNA(Pro) deacylase [Staphylococcus sp. IVB6238]UXR76679.1 Cys-tRNA(Pro) deacylase [Staphylococcus sp. IVB6233]UXR80808.1 Cys-tRNA(Pro) deacylase [Staphylococcus sp. IVB6218]
MKTKKTNAMRILDRAKINYEMRTFEVDAEHIEGSEVAERIGVKEEQVFKTLVLTNSNREYFVFVIPVSGHLDMKAAAASVNEKKLNLMPLDGLKKVTGYIRGGCSPIGMKTKFPTVIDESVKNIEQVFVSAGQRGVQMGVAPDDLIQAAEAQVTSVAVEE